MATPARRSQPNTVPMWIASRGWDVALVVVWLALAVPITLVGTRDIEEYYTGVASTHLGVQALLNGALPFWNVNMGLGTPQPLRFHFLTHPLSGMCAIADCSMVLRGISTIHVLIGAVFMSLLVKRLTANAMLAAVAGITFCLSASIVQTLMTDDWPFTALGDAALPVFLYAALAVPVDGSRRSTWLWTLVLGGLAGLIISMWFPVRTMIVLMITILFAPGLRARFPWLVVAGVIAAMIGAAHVYHLYEQFRLTPPGAERDDHADPSLWFHLWSAFARPIPIDDSMTWRSVFIGPIFAVAGLVSALLCRGPAIRVFRVGLLVSLICWALPERFFFDMVTNRWAFRIGVEVFGIVLAAYGLHRWYARAPETRRWPLRMIVACHLVWMGIAVAPVWYEMVSTAVGDKPYAETRLYLDDGVGTAFERLYAEHPGRVAFGPQAEASLRGWEIPGLGTNQLPMRGIPSLSSNASGITGDALYPVTQTFVTRFRIEPQALESAAFMDVLGVRYVVAAADERVAPDLLKIATLNRGFQLYANHDAWPEAFFVEALPAHSLPRMSGCAHDRFLCADFARANLHRVGDAIAITRMHDGLRLEFPAAEYERQMLVTQWYRDGWKVTEGRASVTKAAEQLIGMRVEPGETAVAIRFRPTQRMSLFAFSLAIEAAVALVVVALWWSARREKHRAPW